jgi:uncharacterized membrane protein YbjE (DUF340 family)
MDQHSAGVVACAVATVFSSWITQHFFKANKDFNTTLAHGIAVAIGIGLYAIASPLNVTDPLQWLLGAMAWAGGFGIAPGSILAGAGLAAKTDSR